MTTNKIFRYYLSPQYRYFFVGCFLGQAIFIFLICFLVCIGRMTFTTIGDYLILLVPLIIIISFGFFGMLNLRMIKFNKKFSYIVLGDKSFVFPFDPDQRINETTINYTDLILVEERSVGSFKRNSYIYIKTNNNLKLEIVYKKLMPTDYDYLLLFMKGKVHLS